MEEPKSTPKSTRLCIYPKDVQRITGKSYSHSCGLIKKIREALGKKAHQAITPEEFSRYLGLPENEVRGKLA